LREERGPGTDVTAFLAGDPATHADMRRRIRAVVTCFRFRGAVEEDLVQEALYRVFQSVRTGTFRGEASLSTFAQRVAEFTCLEHMRRLRYRVEVDPASLPEPRSMTGPESLLLHAEEHRENLRRLAAMPRECRELFRMIFVEGLSYLEIGKRCGISETAVKLRVHRCRLTAREAEAAERLPGGQTARKEAKT
jgi:RNA polymerase sigma-70 factor (ECF subfamily)